MGELGHGVPDSAKNFRAREAKIADFPSDWKATPEEIQKGNRALKEAKLAEIGKQFGKGFPEKPATNQAGTEHMSGAPN